MSKTYPDDFRQEAVHAALRGDRTQRQVADAFGVSVATLSMWLRMARLQSPGDLEVHPRQTSDLEQENRSLREKGRELERENEILRGATAVLGREWLAGSQKPRWQ